MYPIFLKFVHVDELFKLETHVCNFCNSENFFQIFQKSREPVMQWAAMWGQMAVDTEKEMEEAKGKEGETSDFKEENVEMLRLDKMEKRSVMIALMREI